MNFVTWSIRNPVPVIVLFIALTVAGLLSFPKLGVLDRPDIEFPAVIVTVTYPGVAPTQMESEITRKVEDAVATIAGIEQMTSTVDEGASTTSIEFRFGTDLSAALDDVRDAMTRIRSDLPADANEPIVSRVTTAGGAIVTWSVASDNMTDTELSWFVDLTVTRELSAVPGVGRVTRVGGVAREIRVDLDPDRMAALGATASDVSRQLRRIQAEYPGRRGPPRRARADRAHDRHHHLRLRFARAADRVARRPQRAARHDRRGSRSGRRAALGRAARRRARHRLPDRALVGRERARRRQGRARRRRAPAAASIRTSSSPRRARTVGYIQESFDASMEMLIEGAILAIIVVWLFLRDWRATLVSAVALPLSIIPTFWAIWVLGYTLNILTLLALSLVVGILVDDAIVEVENIVRHLRMGKKPKEAAMDAAIEIGLAVVATTLTICAVFVPVAFMSGIAGEFFGPFSFTVVVAVLCSLLVARTLTPMMAAYFLKPHDRPEQPVAHHELVPRARALVPRASLARRSASRPPRSARCSACSRCLSTAFSPAGDNGFTTLERRARAGRVARGHARRRRRRRAGAWTRCPRCAASTRRSARSGGGSGPTGGGSAGNVRRGSLVIQLDNPDGTRGAQQIFERKATEMLRDIPGARFQFGGGGGGSRLQVTLAGDEPNRLEPRGGQRRARDPRDAGPRHDHEQRGAAEARDRDSAAAGARGRARRHDGDAEPRHAHRDERRRQHEPRRSSISTTGRSRSSCG